MIIGLTGPAGSGKDTIGEWLDRMHNYYPLAFASPIREGLCEMLGVPITAFDRANKETVIGWIGKSPRQLMQTLGTEWGRRMVSDPLWVNVLQRKMEFIESLSPGKYHFVITDVRFQDEAAFVRKNGVIWHVSRPGIPRVNEHVSENGLPDSMIDIRIINDGTINDLYAAVDNELPPF